jgi:cell division protein FtsZ
MNSNEIKIIGVGGGAHNVLMSISSNAIENADYIACNTDTISLKKGQLQHKLQIGVAMTKGIGANGNVEVGRLSAIESKDKIEQLFEENSKMAIFIAALGGGTGTGATQVMVQIAKERGLFTIVIVLIPFEFEGEKRYKTAQQGVVVLQKLADFVLVIDNNKIREAFGNLGFKSGFGKADGAIAQFIKMLMPGASSKVDRTDLKKLTERIQQAKSVFFGFGEAQGKFRERKAIEDALKNALSDREDIDGVRHVFLHIGFGNTEISVDEMAQINEDVLQNAGNDANIIISSAQDSNLGDSLSVVLIAS